MWIVALRYVWDTLIGSPKLTLAAFKDPIRRIHLGVQVALILGPTWLWSGSLQIAGLVLFTYFGVYEYILEPISKALVERGKPSLVGPYFERGPQEGEEFIYP